jgi:cation transport ATPase
VVAKADKDSVFGGTIVMEGSALMRVTACGDDSTLGRIISTVQQAQASKPPIQELADRVARYFVPAIASISLVTFLTWIVAYLAGGVPEDWYDKAGNPFLFAFFFALVSTHIHVSRDVSG